MTNNSSHSTPAFDREDQKALERFIRCFDRGAFYTPFHMESSMPDFHWTMTQTIDVLATGLRRHRDGTVIERIKSRHEFTNKNIATALARIQRMVENIRGRFDRHFPFAASEATILLHPRLLPKPNCGFDENACL